MLMPTDAVVDLLKTHFRQLRLPTMGREFERLARDAAATNQSFIQFLLGLTQAELATRDANAIAARIKSAEFPILKDFDTYDFSIMPQLSKPKILELARCEWIEQKYNSCLIGSHGTGKTHIAVSLGLAACRAGLRVRFFTAADLVSQLEKAQKQFTLDRFLGQLERAHLLICDELGYVTLSRGGVELLFRVFGDRYERASVLITSNLPFGEWNQIFQGERMTAALLDRLTHHCHIFEMNGESYRFRESMKSKKGRNSA
jgi:DNA replication protein DnaC